MTDRAWIDDLASRSPYTREAIAALADALAELGHPEDRLAELTARHVTASQTFGWSDTELIAAAKTTQKFVLVLSGDNRAEVLARVNLTLAGLRWTQEHVWPQWHTPSLSPAT